MHDSALYLVSFTSIIAFNNFGLSTPESRAFGDKTPLIRIYSVFRANNESKSKDYLVNDLFSLFKSIDENKIHRDNFCLGIFVMTESTFSQDYG